MMGPVTRFAGSYRFLSNFWVERDGLAAEHRFQAAKPMSPDQVRWILAAPTARQAQIRGRQVPLRHDWERVKTAVMLNVVRYKFIDPVLAGALIATGDAPLEEGNTWGDTFWGIDLHTGIGLNMLGWALMQVRTELEQGAWNNISTQEEEDSGTLRLRLYGA